MDSNRRLIRALWDARPKEIRSAPAAENALVGFESEFGAIPENLRWFLSQCGGGAVGSEWVDDIERLGASHTKYQKGCVAGHWHSNMFVIGWDGGGQPFGLDTATHSVVVESDGEVRQLSPSLEDFLLRGLAE